MQCAFNSIMTGKQASKRGTKVRNGIQNWPTSHLLLLLFYFYLLIPRYNNNPNKHPVGIHEMTVNADNAKAAFQETLDELGFGFGKAMPALRIAITGAMGGPDMMQIIDIIGKQETISRIERAIENIA